MSGSRLPGDSSGTDRHTSEIRAEARLDDKDGRDLATRFQRAAESDEYRSKAELVRKALDEYLPDDTDADGPRIRPPEDDDVASAFRTLQRIAKSRDGVVPEEQALSVIAQEQGITTETACLSILKPLDDQGYVARRVGSRQRNTIRVMLPDDIPDLLEDREGGVKA